MCLSREGFIIAEHPTHDDIYSNFEEIMRRQERATHPTSHWFAEPSQEARPGAADLAFSRTVGFLRDHRG